MTSYASRSEQERARYRDDGPEPVKPEDSPRETPEGVNEPTDTYRKMFPEEFAPVDDRPDCHNPHCDDKLGDRPHGVFCAMSCYHDYQEFMLGEPSAAVELSPDGAIRYH